MRLVWYRSRYVTRRNWSMNVRWRTGKINYRTKLGSQRLPAFVWQLWDTVNPYNKVKR